MRSGAGIGEAIAHVERCRMPAPAELGVGLQSEIIFALADPDDLEPEQVAQPTHPIPRGLDRKDVAPAKAGDGLPERDRRRQPRRVAFKHAGKVECVLLLRRERHQRRRVDEDHQRSPESSSKNALSAFSPVDGGNGYSREKVFNRSRSGTASLMRSSSDWTACRTASCLVIPRCLASLATRAAVASSLIYRGIAFQSAERWISQIIYPDIPTIASTACVGDCPQAQCTARVASG